MFCLRVRLWFAFHFKATTKEIDKNENRKRAKLLFSLCINTAIDFKRKNHSFPFLPPLPSCSIKLGIVSVFSYANKQVVRQNIDRIRMILRGHMTPLLSQSENKNERMNIFMFNSIRRNQIRHKGKYHEKHFQRTINYVVAAISSDLICEWAKIIFRLRCCSMVNKYQFDWYAWSAFKLIVYDMRDVAIIIIKFISNVSIAFLEWKWNEKKMYYHYFEMAISRGKMKLTNSSW